MDASHPVYLSMGSLWQKKYDTDRPARFRMVEDVGLEENPQSKRTAQSVNGIGNADNVIFIPKSFPHLALELLRRFKTKIMKRVPDRRLGFRERAVRPDQQVE